MRSGKQIQLMPPWSAVDHWRDANRAIAYHRTRYHSIFDKVTALSSKLNDCHTSIFTLLDELCLKTCTRCPEPCCLSAKVWFDFQDLLFLHFSSQPIPLAQPLQDMKSTCRYLGHRGCTLPRTIRPWICTWYLCPVQKTNLKNRSPVKLKIINNGIQQIKEYRKEMESDYIRIVS